MAAFLLAAIFAQVREVEAQVVLSPDYTLPSGSYTSDTPPVVIGATHTITTQGSIVSTSSPGDLTLIAGTRVSLEPGFSAHAGSFFHALTMPGTFVPTVTISPIAAQQIILGDTVVFYSTADDPNGQMTSHNFDWEDPNGVWRGSPGALSSTAPDIPVATFPAAYGSARAISFTPSAGGPWQVRFSANSAGSLYTSPQVAVTVIDPVADSDHDGVPDLVEMALGTDPNNASSKPAVGTQTYQYDNNGQLISESAQPANGSQVTRTYQPDPEGNITGPSQ